MSFPRHALAAVALAAAAFPAAAQLKGEVIHWWTSGGESAAAGFDGKAFHRGAKYARLLCVDGAKSPPEIHACPRFYSHVVEPVAACPPSRWEQAASAPPACRCRRRASAASRWRWRQ